MAAGKLTVRGSDIFSHGHRGGGALFLDPAASPKGARPPAVLLTVVGPVAVAPRCEGAGHPSARPPHAGDPAPKARLTESFGAVAYGVEFLESEMLICAISVSSGSEAPLPHPHRVPALSRRARRCPLREAQSVSRNISSPLLAP